MKNLPHLTLLLCLANVPLLCAQVPLATIGGLVKDANSAVVPGAQVTLEDRDHGLERHSTTNSGGAYSISDLQPGSYVLEIASRGFATARYTQLVLQPGEARTIDASLSIATQTVAIDVNTSAQTVDLAQSILQGQITSRTIESIPLNGRNFLELAFLIPGNRPAPNFDPTKNKHSRNQLRRRVWPRWKYHYRRRRQQPTKSSGAPSQTCPRTPLPNSRSQPPASQRRSAVPATALLISSRAAAPIVITDPPSSFERNRHLQALPATFDRTQPIPRFDREQFGGSFGGPLRRDKTFLFSSVEYRNQTPPSRQEPAISPPASFATALRPPPCATCSSPHAPIIISATQIR